MSHWYYKNQFEKIKYNDKMVYISYTEPHNKNKKFTDKYGITNMDLAPRLTWVLKALNKGNAIMIKPSKIKLIDIFESLKLKKHNNGEFIQFDFYDGINYIGNINLRLKRGWNQLHIDIDEKFQGKSYGALMIGEIINEYGYISIPDGRIINSNMHKLFEKLKQKFNYFKTKYDEHIFYKDKSILPKLELLFNN